MGSASGSEGSHLTADTVWRFPNADLSSRVPVETQIKIQDRASSS